tara:strand:- start:326 stop:460 length:135 start_codon:yes stop_codon:yes gene_type:complete
LDIGRVGIKPNADFLTSEEAKRIAREEDFKVLDNFLFEGIIQTF